MVDLDKTFVGVQAACPWQAVTGPIDRLTHATPQFLEVRLLTGEHAGELMFVPWMGIIPNETQVPFKLQCLQFPVQLCFAMTINGSQGESVNHAGMDARSAVFTDG